jgi:hypothetical protein
MVSIDLTSATSEPIEQTSDRKTDFVNQLRLMQRRKNICIKPAEAAITGKLNRWQAQFELERCTAAQELVPCSNLS